VSSSDVYDDEMPDPPLVLDDDVIEAFFSGQLLHVGGLAPLARFGDDIRGAVGDRRVAISRPELALLLSSGSSSDSPVISTGATVRLRGRRYETPFAKRRLAGVLPAAVLGVTLAAASVLGGGAVGLLPGSTQHIVASAVRAVTPWHFPDPGAAGTNVRTTNGGAVTPTPAAGGAASRPHPANQTPAAGQPSTSGTTATTSAPHPGAGATGHDRANQTPAAGHLPTPKTKKTTPTPHPTTPAPHPGAGATGHDRANQTPAAGHLPTTPHRR
jgi:hypothetical protein